MLMTSCCLTTVAWGAHIGGFAIRGGAGALEEHTLKGEHDHRRAVNTCAF